MASKPSAKRVGKEPARYVLVDRGYQTAEHWVQAKVIRSEMCETLFGGPQQEQLYVVLPSGERIHVDRWAECNPQPIGLERIIDQAVKPRPKNAQRSAKTIIHVNMHHVRANKKDGGNRAVLTVKRGKTNQYAHAVDIKGPSKVVYRPDKPLSCGARGWIETKAEVVLV